MRHSPNFASAELQQTWERAGKGKARWKPGDETGDRRDDARLLYTNWKLTPPKLSVRDDCVASSEARIALTYVGLPYVCVESAVDAEVPALNGNGIGEDNAGLAGAETICDFAAETAEFFAITLGAISTLAPNSGRDDIVAWLAQSPPDINALPPLLRGVGKRGLACLNEEGGFSMDDVQALAALSALARAEGTADWPKPALRYLEDGPCAAAGLLPTSA